MANYFKQFVGKDIWVYAELGEFNEDTYIRITYVDDNGDLIFNAWLSDDDCDIDEILYGELTSNTNLVRLYPSDTITTDQLIAMIESENS